MKAGRLARYFLARALSSIKESPLIQLVAVSTIAVSTLVLGVFLLVLLNVDRLTERYGREARLVAFLSEDVRPEALSHARVTVQGWPEVAFCQSKTRSEALVEFRAALGKDSALLDGLEDDVLPASLEVGLKSGTPAEPIIKRLKALPGLGEVYQVERGQDLLARLEKLRDLLRIGGLILGSMIALAVIFIISNTVRLALFARREELAILALVGATPSFVKAPHYLEGAFQGMTGASLGLLALLGLLRLAAPNNTLQALATLRLEVIFLPPSTSIAVIVCAGLVGFLASHLAATRFLRDSQGL